MREEPPIDAERLGTVLKALASPVRLRILESLREPTRAGDVRLRAGEERAGFSAERILSRPAIVQHLQVLEESGLVRRIGAEGYVVDQATVFSLVQELGSLARIRAVVELDVGQTRVARPEARTPPPPRPRMMVVGGPEDGRAYRLFGVGPWRLGRAADCEVRIDYDPHVSRLQATLRRDASGFTLAVEAAAKNPVLVDATEVAPGENARVEPGAVLEIGASRLVLQS